MSNTDAKKRNEQHEWHPAEAIVLSPISAWPPEPVKVLKWLFGRPGFIWPENIFWLSISVITWVFLTPDLSVMKNFELWWIAVLLARNFLLVGLVCGGMHYLLYIRKSQGDKLRFTTRPFATDSRRFRFSNQVRDNMFHTLLSGVPVITAYEAITYWLFANSYIGFIDLANPVAFWAWFLLLLILAPVIHAVHFYLGHRLLHLIGIGAGKPGPSHTTRHAGPHRAVRKVEVMRDREHRGYQSTSPTRHDEDPNGYSATSDYQRQR